MRAVDMEAEVAISVDAIMAIAAQQQVQVRCAFSVAAQFSTPEYDAICGGMLLLGIGRRARLPCQTWTST